MHSFPITGGAKSIWAAVSNNSAALPVRVVAAPIVGLVYLGAVGSFFWLDLVCGVAVAMFFLNLMISLMAWRVSGLSTARDIRADHWYFSVEQA